MIYKSELQPQIDKLRYGFKNRACTQALVKNEEKLKGLVMKDLFRKCRCCESRVCTNKKLTHWLQCAKFFPSTEL